MAVGINNLGTIVRDFASNIKDIFGGSSKISPELIFKEGYGGTVVYDDFQKWIGNTGLDKKVARYGFTIFNSKGLSSGGSGESSVQSDLVGTTYYLTIPPQSISQKELFATNISATRKGIIVESEGVVFKDIVIQGNTGIRPSPALKGPIANLRNPIGPPLPPPNTGFEEFLSLRQYFLAYAAEKVKANGDLFLVFVNEKDNQALIVEPLEFTMDRNSKSPLTYDYRIVLKCIGTFDSFFQKIQLNTLETILSAPGNIVANVSAFVGQLGAAAQQVSGLLRNTFQALDQTINGPLAQLQSSLNDFSTAVSDVLTLPGTFANNFNSRIRGIQASANRLGNFGRTQLLTSSGRQAQAASLSASRELDNINQNDNRVPMTRAFIEDLRDDLQNQSDNISDSLNLGDELYDSIKGRINTSSADILKVASDEEYLLLGATQALSDSMNLLLFSDSLFKSDSETRFEESRQAFQNSDAPVNLGDFDIQKPANVRQIKIRASDTLEKISAREFNDASRWTELVILNNLKPPYIDPAGGDGVKKPGENLLIGAE